MKNTIIIHPDTRTVLKMVANLVAERQNDPLWHLCRPTIKVGTTPDELRSQLLIANNLIKDYNLLNERPYFYSNLSNDWSWFTCALSIDISTIPIEEDEGELILSREDTINIIGPSEIPSLTQFVENIPKTNNRIVLESHSHFGYHFHYCEIKNGKTKRTNLLLTFNPKDICSSLNVPLYKEKHGRYPKPVSPPTGFQKRQLIYIKCHDAMRNNNINIQEFKSPSYKSSIFFP